MHLFRYQGKKLFCEGVSVEELIAKHGTPLYIYSRGTLLTHYTDLAEGMQPLDSLVCFAMKSNSNLSVLAALASQGAGFDIVSAGELERVIEAGGNPRKCVFAGVGKTEEEIRFALKKGIYSFNVESEPELKRIDAIAKGVGKVAAVAVRVNPNVAAGTHKKITTGTYENKFGIAFEEVPGVYARAGKLKNIRLRGVQMHIGSQITDIKPFQQAVSKMLPLCMQLKGRHGLEFFSIGGGIGIVYQDALASGAETWWKTGPGAKVLTAKKYAETLKPLLHSLGMKVLLEPGRFISGNAGILVTRVEYIKRTGRKNFVIVDAAMNDLIRPAFYDAYHEVIPVRYRPGATVSSDVVGPICESGDYFCHDRELPAVKAGDYLALMSAGAYASVMASNYNSRPLAAEVMVYGKLSGVVRERQPVKDIWREERIWPRV